METQTYPLTRYYLRVPGEDEGTWVPVRAGSGVIPEYFDTRDSAILFATDLNINTCKIIEVTERLV